MMFAGFQHYPGWFGAHVRDEVEGALRNGTRIAKAKSEAGDSTPDGTTGTVLGSISDQRIMGGKIMYFVEWDNWPRTAVACIADKLEELHGSSKAPALKPVSAWPFPTGNVDDLERRGRIESPRATKLNPQAAWPYPINRKEDT